MRRREWGIPWGRAAWFLCGLLACSGGPRERPPHLLPVGPRSVRVGETLTVDLAVENPDGLPLTFSWKGPDLPGIDRSAFLSGTPQGARFLYTPLVSHQGEQPFEVRVSSRAGEDRQSFVVTVLPDAASSPSFLRPGPGATLDLMLDPCLRLDVEVRDEDSPQVTLSVRGDLPPTSQFLQTGPKTGEWNWCPTPAEMDQSLQWRWTFVADDEDHPPVEQPFLLVLLRQGKTDCPGAPPVVTVLSPSKGERVASVTGYPVEFQVTDDQGLAAAPTVHWMRGEPEDPDHPDLAAFQTIASRAVSGGFRARIPHFGLGPGEEEVVSLLVVATDNDDASGTACDHRTVSRLHRFIAVGGDPARDAGGTCSPCDFAGACRSGLCALGDGEGRCLAACPTDCPGAADCPTARTLDGGSAAACPGTPCPEQEAAPCEDDPTEPDDGVDRARPWDLGPVEARLCPASPDWYRLQMPGPGRLALSLSPGTWEAGGLDLLLRDSRGNAFAQSASNGLDETLEVCIAAAATLFVEVRGTGEDRGGYRLSGAFKPGLCCADDPGEPDGDPSRARPLALPGLQEGVICPYDSDWFQMTVPAASRVQVTLVSEDQGVDLDLEVYGPSGTLVAFGDAVGDEQVAWSARPGTHWVRVFGYQGHTDSYLLEAKDLAATPCQVEKDCPLGTSCWSGSCVEALCRDAGDCPPEAGCPLAGPETQASLCGIPCGKNADCRDGEACKFFLEGRFCGIRGSGANGASCETFLDCGGQRACLPWPRGYCARAACARNGDCESGTWCVQASGLLACLLACDADASACRQADGYACRTLADSEGASRKVCAP